MLRELNEFETALYDNGHRVVPGVTHGAAYGKVELFRHVNRYTFCRRLFQADLHLRGPASEARVVDLGCGAGYGAEMLASLHGVSVLGIDGSPESIQYCRQTFTRKNLEFRQQRIDEFVASMTPSECDYVASNEVIEHIEDGFDILARLRFARLAVISTPYLEPRGRNPHHVLWDISEASYRAFDRKAFFYMDLPGLIYETKPRSPEPTNLICVLYAPEAERALGSLARPLAWDRTRYHLRQLAPRAWNRFKDVVRPVVRPILRKIHPKRYG